MLGNSTTTAVVFAVSLGSAAAAVPEGGQSRERHQREWDVKAHKMETTLLPTMRSHGVDMWILMSRENHPDAILDLFGAFGVSGWYGHRNAYMFYDPGPEQSLVWRFASFSSCTCA